MKEVRVNGLTVFAGSKYMCHSYTAGLIRQVRDKYLSAAKQSDAEGAARRIESGQLTRVRVSIYDFEIRDHCVLEPEGF